MKPVAEWILSSEALGALFLCPHTCAAAARHLVGWPAAELSAASLCSQRIYLYFIIILLGNTSASTKSRV